MNAANEVAVAAFLANQLAFPAIAAVIEQALDAYERVIEPIDGLAAVRRVDRWARTFAAGAARGVQSTP